MIYDPLIDELAALPLQLLVVPAPEQPDPDQTACLCPFCKAPGSTPHFIIYNKRRGGLYSRPVEMWQCTKTRRSGYGAIELYAAIRGYGYWHRATPTSPSTFICVGEDLRRACLELALKAGHTDEEIQKRWPSLLQREYRTQADRPQERLTFQPKTEFTPQDLAALGCTTWLDRDNVINYGFDTPNSSSPWHFNPGQILSDFNVEAVLQVTLPSVTRSG